MNKTVELNDMPGFMVRNRRWLFILIVPVICIFFYYTNGYLKTSLRIAWLSEKHGVHATLDKAIEDYISRRDDRFPNPHNLTVFKEVDRHYRFIWAACINDKTIFQDGALINDCWWPLVYFIHAKNGWIEYPKEEFSGTTDLGYWMDIYHLYGDVLGQVQ